MVDFDTERVGFTFIWKIENFSLVRRLNQHDVINGNEFTADNLFKTHWYLCLEPIGYSETNKDSFIFRLVKSFTGHNTISLNYELSVLFNGDSKVKSVTQCGAWFHQGARFGKPLYLTPHEIFSKREILCRDTLTVQCKMWHSTASCLEPGFCLSRIRIGVERKTFTWAIDKFSTLQINEKKSVNINFQTNSDLSLTMTLLPTSTCGEKIRINIVGNNEEKWDLLVTLGISVQNINNKSMYHTEDKFKFLKGKLEQPFLLILEKNQLASNKELFLPNDVLSLKCIFIITKLNLSDSIELNCIEQTTYGIDAAVDLKAAIIENKVYSNFISLANDMKYLFRSKCLTDINLNVQNEVFPAHKAILAARSSVFKTMFDTDMKEKFTNTIEIKDFEPDTISRLLLYIYSDTWDSDISSEIASSLCLAAEKYAIIGLKEACISFLNHNITLNNIYGILVLADMLKDEELMNSADDFVHYNNNIMDSNEWEQFSREHSQLTIEILTRLYRNVLKK